MGLTRGDLGKKLPLSGAKKHVRTGLEWQIRCRKKRCCNLYKVWRSNGVAGLYRGLFAAGTEGGRALNGDGSGSWPPPAGDCSLKISSKSFPLKPKNTGSMRVCGRMLGKRRLGR